MSLKDNQELFLLNKATKYETKPHYMTDQYTQKFGQFNQYIWVYSQTESHMDLDNRQQSVLGGAEGNNNNNNPNNENNIENHQHTQQQQQNNSEHDSSHSYSPGQQNQQHVSEHSPNLAQQNEVPDHDIYENENFEINNNENNPELTKNEQNELNIEKYIMQLEQDATKRQTKLVDPSKQEVSTM